MKDFRNRLGQSIGAGTSPTLVLGVAATLILIQVGFRSWAIAGAWFYGDDYNLLTEQIGRSPSAARFLEPYNGHVMPGGKFVAWVVSHAGTLNWELAAGLTVLGQFAASAAALWMLVTLFGPRLGLLVPLTLYLFSAVTLPAYLWWAAALNQLVPQSALFLAVGCWVNYLRTRSWRWLIAATCSIGIGLLFFEKTAFIFPILAFLAVAYFATGSLGARIRTVVVNFWPAVLTFGVVGGAYTAYYMSHVGGVLESPSRALTGELASSMLGTALPVGLVGGPWRWAADPQPVAHADPPAFAVTIAWLVIVAVIAYIALRRERTLRAWLLLSGYVLVLFLLLLSGRATAFGPTIGSDYRFLTDSVAVMMLCLGLASMSLLSSRESSSPRTEPLLRTELPGLAVVGLTAAIGISGVVGSQSYARTWHTTNASDPYFEVLRDSLSREGDADVADVRVPEQVIDPLQTPTNQFKSLVSLLPADIRFPVASNRLLVPDDTGSLRNAAIELSLRGEPGPVAGCGWRVSEPGLTIPLEGRAFDWKWWVRLGYLSSDTSRVRVEAGDSTVETEVLPGPNSLFVQVDGSFDDIRIEDLDTGVTICVDDIQVGQIVPGGPTS